MSICNHTECNIRANFNYISESKGIYCSKHKLNGMIDIKTKKCAENGCNIQPSFNYNNEKSKSNQTSTTPTSSSTGTMG